jgi:apolipoprotein D and lipocalin family protein
MVTKMRPLFVIAMLTFGFGGAAAADAAPAPLRVVPALDLARYAGAWYEIARLPNRFQAKCAGDVVARYEPRPDGRVTVINRCRTEKGDTTEARGVARPVEGQPTSILEVRFAPAILGFLPAVWGDYQVIALGAGYDHAVVGTPDRKYLWILSRTPQMDPALYQRLLEAAKDQGFAVAQVVATPQQRGA